MRECTRFFIGYTRLGKCLKFLRGVKQYSGAHRVDHFLKISPSRELSCCRSWCVRVRPRARTITLRGFQVCVHLIPYRLEIISDRSWYGCEGWMIFLGILCKERFLTILCIFLNWRMFRYSKNSCFGNTIIFHA